MKQYSVNARQRFLDTMRFQRVDRVPLMEFGLWSQTIERWQREGMPRDIHLAERLDLGNEFFGLDRAGWLDSRFGQVGTPPDTVLQEDEQYRIVRHGDGRVVKQLKAGSSGGMRASMDQYLEYPVKCREDWLALVKRLDRTSPARYPVWWDDLVRCLKERDYPVRIPSAGQPGFFSMLRDWMGFERACTVFYDDPAWAHEMMDFIAEHIMAIAERALRDVQVDWFRWHEDFAYKGGPMVSPKVFREFFMPRYRRVNDMIRAHGVDIIFLDSDGDPRALLPLLIEAGVNGTLPIECAAGMDPVELRREYGHDLLMQGGIDKRALARGKQAIREELYNKLPPLLGDGGWIPHVDHYVPPDVSYEDWRYYLDLKRKIVQHG